MLASLVKKLMNAALVTLPLIANFSTQGAQKYARVEFYYHVDSKFIPSDDIKLGALMAY